jgi:hypothetical protein
MLDPLVGPDGEVIDLDAVGRDLNTPGRSKKPLYPSKEELDRMDDNEFLIAVATLNKKEIDEDNQGALSSRTKFKRRAKPRFDKLTAQRKALAGVFEPETDVPEV